MTPWLLVAGDLTPLGGMDAANHALARYLACRGGEVHLVTHRAWPDLAALPGIQVHRAWRPFDRHVLGRPLLARAGRRVWKRLASRGVRALVNGGNCCLADANWVHYVHAAFEPRAVDRLMQAKASLIYQREVMAERAALHAARVVICNSQRTKRDLLERAGVPPGKAHVVYYGSDPDRFALATRVDRESARRAFNWPDDRPLVGFVGALGDRRKAFDTLFAAWVDLCGSPSWDADLIVVGAGAELALWQARATSADVARRVRFLGFRDDVPQILAALDLVVHPARYEAYGLSVHEAICRGVPALVAARAGVAEQYPAALRDLLIVDPDDARELVERLRHWRDRVEQYKSLVVPLSETLRARSWDTMSAEIEAVVERAA
jgi:glycosyltransferase involved in cell wall biosynthesis